MAKQTFWDYTYKWTNGTGAFYDKIREGSLHACGKKEALSKLAIFMRKYGDKVEIVQRPYDTNEPVKYL